MTLPAQLPANHLQQRIGQAANLATDVAEALHAYSDTVLGGVVQGGWGSVRIQEASDSLAKVNHTLINLLNCINDDDFRTLGSF